MSFKRELGTLVDLYRQSLLLANAGAVDYGRDVVSQGSGGHGKHGTRSVHHSFGADRPFPVALEVALTSFVAVWERRLEAEKGAIEADADLSRPAAKTGAVKRAEDAAILADVGADPIDLAFIYRRTTEAITKLRIRHGQDPQTGERAERPRPLTAPARRQLQDHESATTTTEDPTA